MNLLEVFFLSLVEGVTEFLPISSTGHLILSSLAFGLADSDFTKAFNIIIQFGAILAVVVLYWKKFWPIKINFYKNLFVAFIPAAIIGLLVKKKIDLILDSALIVAIALIIGGIILIWTDKKFAKRIEQGRDFNSLSLKECLLIGLFQCLAFIPGVSRSAASILGGMFFGMKKSEAAEFSFFLAVPTLTGAALIKTIGIFPTLTTDHITPLVLGIVLSFIFAWIAIRWMMRIVQNFGFKHFGYYRIILGVLVLILLFNRI